MLLILTIGIGSAFVAPLICAYAQPIPLVIQMIFILVSGLFTFFLPTPGTHLPEVIKETNNITIIGEKSGDVTETALRCPQAGGRPLSNGS